MFFSRLDLNVFSDFIKERDLIAWHPACIDLVPKDTWTIDCLRPLLPEPFLVFDESPMDIILIKTNYKPFLKWNTTTTYPKDNDGRYKFTEKQRKAANMAIRSKDLQDFEDKVRFLFRSKNLLISFTIQICSQLSNGKRERRTQYTWLDVELIDGYVSYSLYSRVLTPSLRKILKLDDANNGLLALVVANMPQQLRRDLIDTIDNVFRDRLTSSDSQKTGSAHTFDSIQFSFYNRYSKRVGHNNFLFIFFI